MNMKNISLKCLWWISFLIVVYLSFFGLNIQVHSDRQVILHNHILAYSWLSALIYFAFNTRKSNFYRLLLFIVGGIIEIIQPYFHRHMLVSDAVMNGVGILIGMLLSMLAARMLRIFQKVKNNQRIIHNGKTS